MLCDAMAVKTLGQPHFYIGSLLRLAAQAFVPSRALSSNAIGFFDANILEKRVMMIQTPKEPTTAARRYGLILVASLCLSAMGAGAVAAPAVIAPRVAGSDDGTPQVFKVGKEVTAPILIYQVDPEFPKTERKGKKAFSGSCEVGLIVDASGVPHDVHIVRSLAADFDASAVKSVQQYRFSPAMHLGKPVSVALFVDVNFALF